MNISAKTDYASRAVLELSLHWPNETPMQMNDIAKNQQIPLKFLTQILIQLKQFGCVESKRGKCGGYLLAKAPKDISLYDIIVNFEPAILNGQAANKRSAIVDIWQDINKELAIKLQGHNFEAIAQKHNTQNDVVMFQI